MARQLDRIVVIDLESTCWRDNPPPGQESEVIEIGVAVLDTQSHKISGSESILIKPERSQVSQFCVDLTSLTQDILEREGISFAEACKKLATSYQADSRTWAGYTDYDRRMLERQ